MSADNTDSGEEQVKRGRGRPTLLNDKIIEQAGKICALGATDIELADILGVDVRTIYRWRSESDKFCQSLRTAKEVADERVERSLYARANGYEHDEVDIRVIDGQIVQTPIRKFYPPDTTAGIFWLKNRRPGAWRETKAVELSGTGEGGSILHKVVREVIDPE